MPPATEHDPIRTLAILPRPRLGDGLVTMVLAENARRAGCSVTVCHDALHALAECFPAHDLRRANALDAKDLAGMDLVYAHTREQAVGVQAARALLIGRELASMRRKLPRAVLYRELARELLRIERPTEENGAHPPGGRGRDRARRVALHPESLDRRSIWPRAHFIELAELLRTARWEPRFLVAPEEAAGWRALLPPEALFVSPDLALVARELAASDFFIGNDSGLGHLASCLGTPTLTLFPRAALARRWRPHWAPSEVVLPWLSPPGAALQLASWTRLLSPARVMRHFDAFARRTASGTASGS